MFAPGFVGLAMGSLILLGVRDSPQSVGYLPVEKVKTAPKKESAATGSAPATEPKKESLIDLLVTDVLK